MILLLNYPRCFIILSMKELEIIAELFETPVDDLYISYKRITEKIKGTNRENLLKEIKQRLKNVPDLTLNKVILIGSVLSSLGLDREELIKYYAENMKERITLTQLGFITETVFEGRSLLPSDIVFDITEYTYLDDRVIDRRIEELSEKLMKLVNPDVVLFLFISFFRDDLRNENLKLLFNILTRIGKKYSGLFKGNSVVKDFLKESIPKEESAVKKTPPKKAEQEQKPKPKPVKVEPEIKKDESPQKEEPPRKKRRLAGLYLYLAAGFGLAVVVVLALFLLIHQRGIQQSRGKESEVLNSGGELIEAEGGKSTTGQDTGAGTTGDKAYQKIEMGSSNTTSERSEKGGSYKEKAGGSKTVSKSTNQMEQGKKVTGLLYQYTVKEGDTLSDIAKRYYGRGYYYRYLAEVNGIENPDLIYPGSKIKIPSDMKDQKK